MSRDTQIEGAHLEQRADLLRERLVRTLDELERRRHAVTSVKAQARRHPAALVAAGAAVLLTLGGGIALGVLRARTRRERLRRERIAAIRRLWRQPERLAQPEGGVLARIGRRILISAGTAAGLWLLRRAARYFLGYAEPLELTGVGPHPALPEATRGEIVPVGATPVRAAGVE